MLIHQSYLIGWEEFRKTKWLMAYILVLLTSLIDWSISLSSSCHEVRRVDAWMNVREAGNLWIKRWPMIIVIWDWDKRTTH